MDNFINICIGLSAIAGTILAILAAYSSNRDKKTEQEIKNIILDISNYCDEMLNYFYDYAKYKEYRIKIIANLESYSFSYERIEKKLENNNRTYLYCINITQILVILIGLSLIFAVANIFDKECLSIILLVILPSIFIIPILLLLFYQGMKSIVNHFIPKAENIIYPKPEALLSPNKDISITKMVFPELLPLRIFCSCHFIRVYDVNSNNMPKNLVDCLRSLDKKKYNTIICLHFKPKFNFLGNLVLNYTNTLEVDSNGKEVKYKIETTDKYILDYENGAHVIVMPCEYSINNLNSTLMLELSMKGNAQYDKIFYSYALQNDNCWSPKTWFLLNSKSGEKMTIESKQVEFIFPMKN